MPAPPKVLIIEDDTSLQTVLERALRSVHPGLGVEWMETAEAALNKLNSFKAPTSCPYQLVVSDILLPGTLNGMDFWQLCGAIFPETPCVLISGMGADQYLKTSGNLAPPFFLPKPFSPKEFKDLMAQLLKK